MEAITFLIDFFFEAYMVVLILRVWLQAVRADFYNPLCQFIVKVTNPLVIPCRRFIPSLSKLDTTTLVLAYLVTLLKYVLIVAISGGDVMQLGILYISVISLIKQAGVLLFILLFVMAIMSWIIQGYNPTLAIFHQLTEPFLRPIRKIIPPIAGFDLSVLFAFVILNVINILLNGFLPFWYSV